VPSGSGISLNVDDLVNNIEDIPGFLSKAVKATMKYHEPRAENWMKTNAPWTDRTTNARNGLAARYAGEDGGVHTMVLFHQVPYGIWLEVRHEGEYAIILPALQEVGPNVMSTLNKILERFPRGVPGA
jgi:hypothetical protein